ncbi:MAG: serine--tRNA ligase, partial [Planctomycetota bacterium]|nr:serine--tRNA ligase [Planctomycetota bacterium]
MIDIKLIRAEPDRYRRAAQVKRFDFDLDALLAVDRQLLEARRELQEVRTAQNEAGKEIAALTGQAKADAIARMKDAKARAKELADAIEVLEPKFNELMLLVPQAPDADVPVGADDRENVELRRVGALPTFDFPTKDHMQLGEALGIIDMPRGVKLAGSRNFVLRGAGAMLHQAVLRLAVDQMVARGYELMTMPVLVNESVMYGTGYFPVGRDQAYLVERDGMSLVGTIEVSLTA